MLVIAEVLECKGEDRVIQPTEDVFASEGDTVTLDCKFETTDTAPSLFCSINPERTEEKVEEGGNINLTCTYDGVITNIQWYRQNQRSRPEFLLYITEGGSIHPTDSDFSAYINKTEKRVNLEISSAALTDSAVYYCALRSTNMEQLTIIFILTLLGNTLEDDITASSAEVFSSEGHSVTLSCKYSVKAYNLQWYQQDPGSAPQFLLLISDTSDPTVVTAKPPHPRLTVKLNKERNRVDLQISSAALTDSAVYYCALRPTSVKEKTE
ncbi:uncharacterized protein [Labrus bergylta]|uniref:uncharacterized protein n=1 Tax=Labrus bergylta TaxID=56723 RepID=UPI003314006B